MLAVVVVLVVFVVLVVAVVLVVVVVLVCRALGRALYRAKSFLVSS